MYALNNSNNCYLRKFHPFYKYKKLKPYERKKNVPKGKKIILPEKTLQSFSGSRYLQPYSLFYMINKEFPEKINNPFDNESFKLEDAEKKHILWVYKVFKENILQAAEALNISKNTLKDRLDKYGVR